MRFINVRDNKDVFADGIHDDTKALQSCLDELRDGGTIYFPRGTYLLSGALIFYSHQRLRFADEAVMLRSAKSDPITRYLLASYSEPDRAGYDGTRDVVISGGVFDGNAELSEMTTLVNTVHCSDITIENCRFVHGARWHYIELNGTENTVVRGCVFDGTTYTMVPDHLLNEQIQLDLSRTGSYGPIYDCDGKLIDFCSDGTPCRGIVIENNLFICDGFPGIGHHGDGVHHDIDIRNNIFDGPSGRWQKSRGYIIFRPQVEGVRVYNNAFLAPEENDEPNIGMISENPDETAMTETDNVFRGRFTEIIRHGADSVR
ncbi:MAG: glycoside hydrolase family 55 protein [Clostridiales bacterium]|nr:glycoside hydrolase family 55 protein [Clostridiales bacterium]